MTSIESIKSWARSQARRNNKRKGDQFQDEIADFLRARGWLVDVVQASRRLIMRRGRMAWITTKEDILGAFDMIAIRKDTWDVLLIQATTDRGMIRRKERAIEDLGVVGYEGSRRFIVWTRALPPGRWEAWALEGSSWISFNPEERYHA